MNRPLIGLVLVISLAAPVLAGDVLFEGRIRQVDTKQVLPGDLILPEGKTRWDLLDLELSEVVTRKLIGDAGNPAAIDRIEFLTHAPEILEVRTRIIDPSGGDAARRWVSPHEDPYLLSVREVPEIRLSEGTGELRIETRRVGMGWLILPSGPREVVLQRAWIRDVSESDEQDHGTLIHRWIDPRAGEVARVWGPASSDGKTRVSIEGAEVVEAMSIGAAPLKLYPDMIQSVPCGPPPDVCDSRLAYGYAREGFCGGNGAACVDSGDCGVLAQCFSDITQLTVPSYGDMGALVAAGAWDFSPNDSTNDVALTASIAAEVDPAETCNAGQCGFVAGRTLSREDKFENLGGTVRRTLSVVEREEPGDAAATIWLRAGARNEGYAGGLGAGESRFCYDPAEGYTPVPLWKFQTQDAEGWFMQDGDAWGSEPYNCEQNIFNHVCPSNCDDVTLCRVYAGTHPSWCNDRSGTQTSTVVAEGPVTLPSGHVFQSLVVRNVNEFCVWIDDANCSGFLPTKIRTIVYLWQVPYLGTVARIVSPQEGPADYVSFSDVAEADIKFGLFPPISVTGGTTTDDSVQLSWDPGTETDEIDGYAVHWGPVSGVSVPYPNRTAQPATAGTTATIGSLQPGTEYFFTVTSLSDYENPATLVTKTFESMLFPMTIEANGGGLVPVEVSATTTCTSGIPPVEIQALTVDKLATPQYEICWEPSTNACITGYEILGASSPEDPGNFSVLATHTGPGSCYTLDDPVEEYFLVRATGTGGSGPM